MILLTSILASFSVVFKSNSYHNGYGTLIEMVDKNCPFFISFLMNFRYHNTMKKYLPCVLGLQDSFMKARDSLDMVFTCSFNEQKMHITYL